MYVRFYPYRGRTEDCYIKAKVAVPDGYYQFNIPHERVKMKDWDKKKGRAKKSHTSSVALNRYLNKIEMAISDKVRELIIEQDYSRYTVEKFINDYFQKGRGDDFVTFFDSFIKIKERASRSTDRNHLGRKYTNIKNKILSYDPHVRWSRINQQFLAEWAHHLFDEYELGTNTAAKYVKDFKSFLHYAKKQGHISERNDYAEFSIARVEVPQPYLTTAEVDKLYKATGLSDELHNTRLLLLKGCYSGQRYSDWDMLNIESVFERDGAYYLQPTYMKSRNFSYIRVHEKFYKVLQQPTYPLTNPAANRNIKNLCEEVGIDEPFLKTTYKGNVMDRQLVPKYQVCSSHIGRRSFACNAILAGINPEIIMAAGGWKSYKTFKGYINLSSIDGTDQFDLVYN